MVHAKVYHMWMILQPSGVDVLSAKINPLPSGELSDPQLLGGLCSSFMNFTHKLLHEPIRLFETESYQLVFIPKDKFFIVILADAKIPKGFIERITNKMTDLVGLQYPQITEEDFNGDLAIYDKIQASLEEILELKGIQKIKLMRSMRKKLNSKENLQQITEDINKID